MRKVTLVLIAMVILLVAAPVYAQTGAPAASGINMNWAFAGVGLGIAVAGAAVGQGKVASAAAEGLARNPAARAGIQLALILGLAFIESLVLFIWVMVLIKS